MVGVNGKTTVNDDDASTRSVDDKRAFFERIYGCDVVINNATNGHGCVGSHHHYSSITGNGVKRLESTSSTKVCIK